MAKAAKKPPPPAPSPLAPKAATKGETLTVERARKLKVAELKKELSSRGLSGVGRKASLVERLVDYLEQ